MTPASPLPLRCWAEVDLGALESNLRLIRASLPAQMRYVSVVKADAYGHGLHQVAARVMHGGADLFAVANVSEAAGLRELGAGWPVLLLSPLLPEEDPFVAEYDLAATVSSLEEVQRLAAVGLRRGREIPIHLKIDTGMGRLGIWHEQAHRLLAAIRTTPGVHLDGVFTHFSSSDEDLAFTHLQRRRFIAALARDPDLDPQALLVHADNSAGLESIEAAGPFNAVRVGLLQFGILPHPGSLLARVRTKPVFSFHTRVGLVKRLPRGTGISYGQTYLLKRESTVAILTAGYGDGIPRATSNRAYVLVHGRRCPVLGRITMDQTIIDVSEVPGVACGDEVILVGRQQDDEISIAEFSQWANTIPWETLCAITKRVPRIYRTSFGL